jgi:tetratricopeptide (TPR) repeat protein
MIKSDSLDQREAWVRLGRKLATLIRRRDHATGIAELDAFLPLATDAEILSQALDMRAIFKEWQGDLEGAEKDLLQAHALAPPGFGRYAVELGLGGICEKRQRPAEAVSWYRAALETSVEADGVAAGGALRSFLRLRPEQSLSPEERSLCARVVEHSWEVLELPGQPDLADLKKGLAAIMDGEAQPPTTRRVKES